MTKAIKARIFFALELLLVCFIVLSIFIPLIPVGPGLPSRDSGVFLYTGWRVLQGEIPYLQIWDHKPPVIYYLDAFGLWLGNGSILGVWVLEVIFLWVAASVCFMLTKRIFGLFTAIVISFLWIFSAIYFLVGGNLTTEYPLPMQFCLLWFFYEAEKSRSYGWKGIALGVISAFLFFTRQTAIAIPVAIGIYLVLARIRNREYRRLLKDGISILAGSLIVICLITGYFAFKGALQPFWDIAFLYNFSYVDERDNLDRIYALAQGLNQLQNIGLAQLSFLGWAAAFVLSIFNKERIRSEVRPLIIMALLAFPLEMWFVSLGGRPRVPYFLVLIPIFSIFAGFIFWLIFESILKDVPVFVGAGLVVFLVFSLGFVFIADYSEMAKNSLQPSEGGEIISYIRDHSAPNDFVLMWGAEASYNFASRRASPSRFVYQTPLYNEKNQDDITEFLQNILDKKPRLIVLRSVDKLSDFRFGYRDNQIGSLMDQIKGSYQNTSSVGDWVVYSQNGQ